MLDQTHIVVKNDKTLKAPPAGIMTRTQEGTNFTAFHITSSFAGMIFTSNPKMTDAEETFQKGRNVTKPIEVLQIMNTADGYVIVEYRWKTL